MNKTFKNLWDNIFILVGILIIAFALFYGVYSFFVTNFPDEDALSALLNGDVLTFISTNNFAINDFVILFSSWGISILALGIAIKTYSSIDVLNKITSMEGNVLENENYSVNYSEKIRELCGIENDTNLLTNIELQNYIFNDIEKKVDKDYKTCMEFTRAIQYVIDNLIWFAYFSNDIESLSSKIIPALKKNNEKFNEINNGTIFVIDENIKLIEKILYYQHSRQNNAKNYGDSIKILDIRQGILINPVARAAYYNYLGLEYKARASKLISKYTGNTKDEFIISNILNISNIDFEKAREEIIHYSNLAITAFSNALELSMDDILFKGHLNFSIARMMFIKNMVNAKNIQDNLMENSEDVLIDTINMRKSTIWILGESGNISYLQKRFRAELDYAKVVHYSFKVIKNTLTDFDKLDIQEIKNIAINEDKSIYGRVLESITEMENYSLN